MKKKGDRGARRAVMEARRLRARNGGNGDAVKFSKYVRRMHTEKNASYSLRTQHESRISAEAAKLARLEPLLSLRSATQLAVRGRTIVEAVPRK